MNFKHELSPSKPLLRSTQSLILGTRQKSMEFFIPERETPQPVLPYSWDLAEKTA